MGNRTDTRNIRDFDDAVDSRAGSAITAQVALKGWNITAEVTGTGSPQNVAIQGGVIPTSVVPVGVHGHDGGGGAGATYPTFAYGTHTTSAIVVTAPAGSKFRFLYRS